MTALHKPVLLTPAINLLNIQTNEIYVDATFGRGGHSLEMIRRGGKVIAFDHDNQAIEYGRKNFENELKAGQLTLIRENFDHIEAELEKRSISQISGILFDFGTSVDQLKSQDRGFSFESNSELDMRMDDRLGVKAKDLLMILPENQLATMLKQLGGEEQSKGIARRIAKQRLTAPITTTEQLINIIKQVKGNKPGSLHPATKVFQALRIAVNTELESIKTALPQALKLIKPEGMIVTISFHEGEDAIAKHQMKQWQQDQLGELITKKPVQPDEQELAINPRARSAKLRAFRKY